jgi:hypothetical protein
MAFCKEYNAQTAKMAGDVVPVEITVYEVRRVGKGCVVADRHIVWGEFASFLLPLLWVSQTRMAVC